MLLQHLNDLGTDAATILVRRDEKGTVNHRLRVKVENSGLSVLSWLRIKCVASSLSNEASDGQQGLLQVQMSGLENDLSSWVYPWAMVGRHQMAGQFPWCLPLGTD
jgi:hypothetical protein